MALRTPLFLGNPAVQHSAQNDRLGLHGAIVTPEVGSTATTRPLTSQGGALIGPPGTMGEVTLLSNTGFTINPARFMIPGSTGLLEGVYEVVNDAVSPTLPVPAQHATQFRRSYVGVWVRDSFPGNAGPDDAQYGTADGALAASNPALPLDSALPANFLKLGELTIPPAGQAVTWTPYLPRTGLRGAILPVLAADTALPAFDGQYRDHPSYGLQRGASGAWGPPATSVPFVALKRNTAQSIQNTGFTTAVAWNVEQSDQYDMWASGTPTRITCKVAGLYEVRARPVFEGNTGGFSRGVHLRVNGSATAVDDSEVLTTPSGSAARRASPTTIVVVQLAVNDYLEVFPYQDSGAALNLSATAPYFSSVTARWIRT